METDQENKKEKAEGFLSRLFTGWGVPGSVARILAGAIVGAVAAWVALSQSGCTADYSQNADGSLQYHGTIVLPQK